MASVICRSSAAPRTRFVQLTVGLTVLTCVGPIALAGTASSMLGLVTLHVVAAATVIPVLARRVAR